LVGGTGLYISAIVDNYQLPQAPPDRRLRDRLERLETADLHLKLQALDPAAARAIHPNNRRYVIRAIEIALQTKEQKNVKNKLADQSKAPEKSVDSPKPVAARFQALIIGIDWPREELYRRIEKRIDRQMEAGLLDETKKLLEKYSKDLPAMTSLGYQELGKKLTVQILKNRADNSSLSSLKKSGYSTGVVEKSDCIDLKDAIKEFKQHTRNYAKRQLTWFRRYKNVSWIPGPELESIINSINANSRA